MRNTEAGVMFECGGCGCLMWSWDSMTNCACVYEIDFVVVGQIDMWNCDY